MDREARERTRLALRLYRAKLKTGFWLKKLLGGLEYTRCFEYPWALQNLNILPEEEVLDVGASNTPFPSAVALISGSRVVAMDCDPIVKAQKKYAAKAGLSETYGSGPRLSTTVGDLRRLPFRDGSFRKILCISTIEHVEGESGDVDGMKELGRILSPGGLMALTVPSKPAYEECYSERDIYERKYKGDPILYLRYYDNQTVHKRLIEPTGLEPVLFRHFEEQGRSFDGLYYRLHRRPAGRVLTALSAVLANRKFRPCSEPAREGIWCALLRKPG